MKLATFADMRQAHTAGSLTDLVSPQDQHVRAIQDIRGGLQDLNDTLTNLSDVERWQVILEIREIEEAVTAVRTRAVQLCREENR